MDTNRTKIHKPLLRGKRKVKSITGTFEQPTCHIFGVEVIQSSNITELRGLLEFVTNYPDYPEKEESIRILTDILEGWKKWAYIN